MKYIFLPLQKNAYGDESKTDLSNSESAFQKSYNYLDNKFFLCYKKKHIHNSIYSNR